VRIPFHKRNRFNPICRNRCRQFSPIRTG